MRAARFRGNGRIELVEVDVPEPGPGEVLLRVHSCALCGSDRDGYLNGSAVTPGHEVSGVIDAAGDQVTLRPGTPGVVYLVGYCGRCYCCRANLTNMCLAKQQMYGFSDEGGFSDRIVVRADCFLEVAETIALDHATALLDLYGTTNHAFRRAGGVSSKSVVCWWWVAGPSASAPSRRPAPAAPGEWSRWTWPRTACVSRRAWGLWR
ncbi:MAG: alcohol dehydrogenase catalytic domain-containing protein [Actinomycetota bacterium]|nr:alcohol dehydrogenase catalytic domain-containing protein [Actinomycetota bacterium]